MISRDLPEPAHPRSDMYLEIVHDMHLQEAWLPKAAESQKRLSRALACFQREMGGVDNGDDAETFSYGVADGKIELAPHARILEK